MAVGFDNVEGLDALWELHKQSKLNDVMQEILVTPGILKGISAGSVTLETRLWEDEYEKCKKELKTTTDDVQNIRERDGDMKLIKRLKNYQKNIGKEISTMRDLDNEMESNRASFISCVYNILPENQTTIASLREFEKITNVEKARKIYNRKCIDLYYSIIKKWRVYFKTFDTEIITPLLQIHRACETQKQREVKSRIINSIYDMQQLLKPESSLLKVSNQELAKKIIRRDAPLFLGLLSLVPLGVERISDVDLMLDEYMLDFDL